MGQDGLQRDSDWVEHGLNTGRGRAGQRRGRGCRGLLTRLGGAGVRGARRRGQRSRNGWCERAQ